MISARNGTYLKRGLGCHSTGALSDMVLGTRRNGMVDVTDEEVVALALSAPWSTIAGA